MKVSIVLPIYNRVATLPRCLASIRAQTFADWELIAVDDGSSDASAELVTGDSRFRLLRHEKNRGASAARNTALAAAQGELIALIDSDDEWLPTKLERQLARMNEREADGCGCEYWVVDGASEKRVTLPEPASWAGELHERCDLGNGTTLLARRECLLAIGPLDEQLRVYEDWDWMLRFTGRFSYTVLHEPLARVHVTGPRNPAAVAQGSERFLENHAVEFAQRGRGYVARLRSLHYEYVAGNAFAQRQFALGCRYALKSVAASPTRRPALLGALPLAAVDAVFGTSLLRRVTTKQK